MGNVVSWFKTLENQNHIFFPDCMCIRCRLRRHKVVHKLLTGTCGKSSSSVLGNAGCRTRTGKKLIFPLSTRPEFNLALVSVCDCEIVITVRNRTVHRAKNKRMF